MSNTPSKPASSFTSLPSGDATRLKSARAHALVRKESQRDGDERERPADLGGLRLQMGVHGDIPGYHLYWENDENGAIEQLLLEGFDFVTQDELQDREAKIVPDLDISSVMSRFVKGTRTDGSALRAYLMKCTDDVWANRERQRHAMADEWDRQIRAQAEAPDASSGMRKLKGVNSSIDTAYRKEH